LAYSPRDRAKNITLTAVANHFHLWPIAISRSDADSNATAASPDLYRTWLDAT
jgi:hypothetical protein